MVKSGAGARPRGDRGRAAVAAGRQRRPGRARRRERRPRAAAGGDGEPDRTVHELAGQGGEHAGRGATPHRRPQFSPHARPTARAGARSCPATRSRAPRSRSTAPPTTPPARGAVRGWRASRAPARRLHAEHAPHVAKAPRPERPQAWAPVHPVHVAHQAGRREVLRRARPATHVERAAQGVDRREHAFAQQHGGHVVHREPPHPPAACVATPSLSQTPPGRPHRCHENTCMISWRSAGAGPPPATKNAVPSATSAYAPGVHPTSGRISSRVPTKKSRRRSRDGRSPSQPGRPRPPAPRRPGGCGSAPPPPTPRARTRRRSAWHDAATARQAGPARAPRPARCWPAPRPGRLAPVMAARC
jgi:hypothetical protein